MTTETLNKVERRRFLTPELIKEIADIIADGNYNNTACSILGVNERVFYQWLQKGQEQLDARSEDSTEPDSIYTQLYHAIKMAAGVAEAQMVNVVRKNANEKGDWLPAMTFLERRHPDRWGRRERKQIDITEHKHIEITHIETVRDYGKDQAIEATDYKLIESKLS